MAACQTLARTSRLPVTAGDRRALGGRHSLASWGTRAENRAIIVART